jgi:hypothetical protein
MGRARHDRATGTEYRVHGSSLCTRYRPFHRVGVTDATPTTAPSAARAPAGRSPAGSWYVLRERGTGLGPGGTVVKALAELTAAGELVKPRDRRGYRLPDWPRQSRTPSLFD